MNWKIGDKVDALCYPNNVVIGEIVQIDRHMAQIKNSVGVLSWTPIVLLKTIK